MDKNITPETQLEMIKKEEQLFNKVREGCFSKCISRFAEADLSPGESICIDRCVVKYLTVYEKVGNRLNSPSATSQSTLS